VIPSPQSTNVLLVTQHFTLTLQPTDSLTDSVPLLLVQRSVVEARFFEYTLM
jgi:hypothetical protein